jgi:hypothetical protein
LRVVVVVVVLRGSSPAHAEGLVATATRVQKASPNVNVKPQVGDIPLTRNCHSAASG